MIILTHSTFQIWKAPEYAKWTASILRLAQTCRLEQVVKKCPAAAQVEYGWIIRIIFFAQLHNRTKEYNRFVPGKQYKGLMHLGPDNCCKRQSWQVTCATPGHIWRSLEISGDRDSIDSIDSWVGLRIRSRREVPKYASSKVTDTWTCTVPQLSITSNMSNMSNVFKCGTCSELSACWVPRTYWFTPCFFFVCVAVHLSFSFGTETWNKLHRALNGRSHITETHWCFINLNAKRRNKSIFMNHIKSHRSGLRFNRSPFWRLWWKHSTAR